MINILNKAANEVRNEIVGKYSKKRRCGTESTGLCAQASVALFKHLEIVAPALNPQFAYTSNKNGDRGNHVFLVVNDWIVDITIDQFPQFRGTKQWVYPKNTQSTYWADPIFFDSPEDLIEQIHHDGWSCDQIPDMQTYIY